MGGPRADVVGVPDMQPRPEALTAIRPGQVAGAEPRACTCQRDRWAILICFPAAVARRGGQPRRQLTSTGARTAAAAAAGNQLGITSARDSSLRLCSAHLCTAVTCGIVLVTRWRG
jgi:hypothetical protein